MNAVHELVKGAGLILDSAAADALPMPLTVAASYGTVSIQVATPDDVKAWARWRGLDVHPLEQLHAGDRFVRISGDMYDVPFAVYAVAPQLEPMCGCGHSSGQHTAIGCGAYVGLGHNCSCSKSSGAVERDALDAEHAAKATQS